ncbi:hypothetical protein [Natrialba sp. PRR66]|uniref:hypothetical protein n=1 Tax=Natrialba sp. PRR66 TaxID=3098146 RepID=UPI002B1DC39D|nr:hypothetical protein [Natrialba sp. PRR66]
MTVRSRLSTLFSWDNGLIAVILGILALLLWQSWLLTSEVTQQFSNRVDAMNVATTALLTLVLIGVYVKMARDNNKQTRQMAEQVDSMVDQTKKMERQLESIELQTESMERQTEEMEKQAELQEQVTEIQRRQQRLMEAKHQPELVLQDTFSADGDILILELSNKGTGLAKNISLDIDFLVNKKNKNTRLVPIEERVVSEEYEDEKRGEIIVRRGFKEVSHSLSRSSESKTPSVDVGTVLPAGETDRLTSEVRLWQYSGAAASPGDGHPASFSEAVRNLQDMGVKVLAYRIKLTYQNILDEDHDPQHLATGAVRIPEDPCLQDLLDARHTTGIMDYSSVPVVETGLRAEFNIPRY